MLEHHSSISRRPEGQGYSVVEKSSLCVWQSKDMGLPGVGLVSIVNQGLNPKWGICNADLWFFC